MFWVYLKHTWTIRKYFIKLVSFINILFFRFLCNKSHLKKFTFQFSIYIYEIIDLWIELKRKDIDPLKAAVWHLLKTIFPVFRFQETFSYSLLVFNIAKNNRKAVCCTFFRGKYIYHHLYEQLVDSEGHS